MPTFVNDIGKYFVAKIEMIQQKLDAHGVDPELNIVPSAGGNVLSLSEFKTLAESEVKSLIHQCGNRHL